MWDIVWVSPLGHRSVSVSRHFLLQAQQCPCSVRKRFSRDHCCWGRSKPGCRIVGSDTRWELTTWADFQLCLHRPLMVANLLVANLVTMACSSEVEQWSPKCLSWGSYQNSLPAQVLYSTWKLTLPGLTDVQVVVDLTSLPKLLQQPTYLKIFVSFLDWCLQHFIFFHETT